MLTPSGFPQGKAQMPEMRSQALPLFSLVLINRRFCFFLTKLCGVLVFRSATPVSSASPPPRRLLRVASSASPPPPPPPPPPPSFNLSHTTLSHTIFHPPSLSHTIFHTPSLSHTSFTPIVVTHHLSHTTLSHTIFHTPSLSRTIFHTHLCHTPSFTQAWHLATLTFVLRGGCGTYGSALGLVVRLGAVAPRHFRVAGDIHLRFR